MKRNRVWIALTTDDDKCNTPEVKRQFKMSLDPQSKTPGQEHVASAP